MLSERIIFQIFYATKWEKVKYLDTTQLLSFFPLTLKTSELAYFIQTKPNCKLFY